MPPTWVSGSMTMGVISDRLKSSRAAVRPAGPAPAITAIVCFLSLEGMEMYSGGAALDEKKPAARLEIPSKGKAGRSALGNEVVCAEEFDAEGHGGGVDRDPDHSNTREARKLDA